MTGYAAFTKAQAQMMTMACLSRLFFIYLFLFIYLFIYFYFYFLFFSALSFSLASWQKRAPHAQVYLVKDVVVGGGGWKTGNKDQWQWPTVGARKQ